MADLSYMYNKNTFIKEVVNNRYIQIQDTYGVVRKTIDYQTFGSAVINGRILIVTKSDETQIQLQFINTDDSTVAIGKLLEIIGQLKNGTYTNPTSTSSTTSTNSQDYSILYHSSNFIKEVKNNLIQIQDRLSQKIRHSIDFKLVTSTITNNRFLVVYRTNQEKISLQFITSEDAQTALNIFMNTVDQLKDNTYFFTNGNLSGDIYDPDTFIVDVSINEHSVKLKNNKEIETHSIVAEQVTSIYAIENYVKVKTEASDNIITLTFETSTKAVDGAEKLREAIKSIVDRILSPIANGSINSYSQIFATQSTWTLSPDINFDMDSFMIQYYEYVCPTESNCLESEKVKQECEGLVEIVGNESTNVLETVTIKFNQPLSGKAIILSK